MQVPGLYTLETVRNHYVSSQLINSKTNDIMYQQHDQASHRMNSQILNNETQTERS
jgi:hypothetical protein